MKKVIVLGSNGQLGKTIQDCVKKDIFDVHFFSRNQLDITNKDKLEAVFSHSNFDYCINCAAYTNVEGAEKNIEEAFLINAEAVNSIAETCAINQVKLVHISTDYVFDGKKREPYTTSDKTNPINQYGKSKLRGELYIKEKLEAHYIIRTSWLYSLYGKNFLKTIISKVENDDSLNITTEEEGTPTSCVDLGMFILHLIEADNLPYGIYHFSANGSTTWFGFAKEIIRNLMSEKLDKILPSKNFKTFAKRPKYSILSINDTEKYYRTLNSWQESVKTAVNVYKNKRT